MRTVSEFTFMNDITQNKSRKKMFLINANLKNFNLHFFITSNLFIIFYFQEEKVKKLTQDAKLGEFYLYLVIN